MGRGSGTGEAEGGVGGVGEGGAHGDEGGAVLEAIARVEVVGLEAGDGVEEVVGADVAHEEVRLGVVEPSEQEAALLLQLLSTPLNVTRGPVERRELTSMEFFLLPSGE